MRIRSGVLTIWRERDGLKKVGGRVACTGEVGNERGQRKRTGVEEKKNTPLGATQTAPDRNVECAVGWLDRTGPKAMMSVKETGGRENSTQHPVTHNKAPPSRHIAAVIGQTRR